MRWYWETAVEPLLEAVEARTIVEVGVQEGITTAELIAFAERNDGIVHGIDPVPLPRALELAERSDRFVLHRDQSLDALPRLEVDLDAALIDGDHNWYTVINELRLLAALSESRGRDFPLTLLHDVGWPYGRRDQYFDPAAIPEEHRHPMGGGGLWPGRPRVHEDSGLNPKATHALSEGTPRNGVLTAVEDFVAESDQQFELTVLTGLFGLAILISRERLASSEPLRACLDSFRSPEWLEAECRRLEHARLMSHARLDTVRHRLKELARGGHRPAP